MAPVIHCSAGNISLFHRTTFFPRKDIHLTKYNAPGKYARLTSYYERLLLPHTSLGPFQIYRIGCGSKQESRIHIIGAVGTDVTVEEPNPVVSGEDADGTFKSPAKSVETSETAPANPAVTTIARSKRPRSVRKSEMPPVKDEELVPGASFTGKVRSIQPFGAFVDFGAYTEGLVHVSRMSDSYVKDVGAIVSVGQEVKVRIVEANKESGRISLTMRDSDDASKIQQRKEASAGGDSDKPRTVRKNTSRPNQKREAVQKSSKFVKGQVLDGTVKNLTRSGAFVSLPDGEEGFLPVSEESEGFDSMLGNSSLQVGQEVNVRVLRIARGKVTLTMKKEDVEGLNIQLNQGVVHMATNPFEMAFRKNKDIAAFLEEQERMQKASEKLSMSKTSEQVEEKVTEPPTKSGALEVDGTEASIDENLTSVPSASGVVLEVENFISEDLHEETSEQVEESVTEAAIKSDTLEVDGSKASSDENPISVSSASGVMLEDEKITPEETSDQVEEKPSESITKSDDVEVNGSQASVDENLISVSSASDVVLENEKITSEELYEETSSVDPISTELDNNEEPASSSAQNADAVVGILTEDESSKTLTGSSLESVLDEINVPDDVKDSSVAVENVELVNSSKSLTSEESGSYVNGSSSNLAADKASIANEEEVEGKNIKAVEENEKFPVSETLVTDEVSIADEVKGAVGATITEEANSESLRAEITGFSSERTNLDTQLPGESDILSSESVVSEEVANSKLDGSLVQDEVMTESPLLIENEMASSNSKDVKVNDLEVSNEQTGIPDQGSAIKAMVSPALVKQLREETGAGMMDCKKALIESGGDIVKAQEFLRKKGLASADKKASRATAEGRVGSYIHDNRIGVLIEVNCETDFVSRGEIFKQLVDDLAMQVAACPQVRYLATEDVPEEFVNKEREIEMQKEDLLTKPEQIRSKIVDGRIRKRLEGFALLEQPYIKNDKVVVKDLVKQTIATIGENIKVNRFVRYNLGEGLEKKSQDFAAEVAAQTAAKSSPAAPKDQSAETKEAIEKAPKVAVSAALVKQLREETGAGMMDCKKALSETGGDLEKAQEYLLMKGLSSADKKSSRLAAEGRISSYIHDSRIGALIEVNSETDFVARNEKFKELVEDLAMQVVACPQVEFVSMEDIPESLVNKEKEIEMQREDLKLKPDHIREKIVEGRISKRLGELALLEQPFIKDDSVMVKDLVKQTVAALGENIKVRRFVRFTLGESKD